MSLHEVFQILLVNYFGRTLCKSKPWASFGSRWNWRFSLQWVWHQWFRDPEFRNLFWAHLKPTHSADLFLDSRVLQRLVVLCFQDFWKVCAVIRPKWPFAHGDTSHWTIWTAAIHAVHNWPQRPRSHVVCFLCDSNPYNALVIVRTTLMNLHEEKYARKTLPQALQSRNEQSIEQLLPCQKNISTCASSMSCQSCQLMWRSRCNPVHIDHQYWRKGRHAGVSQWPLCENHCLHSLHPRQSSDQWRVSPSQCWKMKKLDFGRRRKPCVKRILGCWCCCVTASRNLVASRNHVACSSSEQEWEEHWTTFAVPEEYKYLC